MSEKTTTDKIIESQKEALAIELLARFAHKTFGRNGAWNDEVKKHFVDGALWAFSRYEAIDSVIGEQDKWISVNDRLPEITMNTMSDWVLTFDPHACRIDKAFYSKVTGWQAEHGEPMTVTHWQPLPAPPLADLTQKTKEDGK